MKLQPLAGNSNTIEAGMLPQTQDKRNSGYNNFGTSKGSHMSGGAGQREFPNSYTLQPNRYGKATKMENQQELNKSHPGG